MFGLNTLIDNELNKDDIKNKALFQLSQYSGITLDDNFIIEHFPIKRNIASKLKQVKELMFFLASNYNYDNGVFFTEATLKGAHIDCSQHHSSLARYIQGLINCKVLFLINPHYQFGTDQNFCKMYGLAQLTIVHSFESEYIKYLQGISKKNESLYKVNDFISISYEATNKGKTLRRKADYLNKIQEFTKGTFDSFQQMLTEYNEDKTDYNTKTIKFNFKGSEVTARAYSPYISTSNEKYGPTDRTAWRNQNGLKYNYDIKSAVPRVSHLLATGEWKEESYDFYEEINKRSNVKLSRDETKKLHMRLRFSKSSKASFNSFCYANQKCINREFPTSALKDDFYGRIKPNMYKDYKQMYDVVEELEGKDHSSDIFYFESLLELYVIWKMKKMGITAYAIYDEFYYNKKCDIQTLLIEAANYVVKSIGGNMDIEENDDKGILESAFTKMMDSAKVHCDMAAEDSSDKTTVTTANFNNGKIKVKREKCSSEQ